jgi:hypothetical protein
MSTRYFALFLGVIYLIIGVAGFIPGLVTEPRMTAPHLAIDAGHGLLFGLFPVNFLHNIVHLAVGVWGILSSLQMDAARIFARATAIIFAVLTVMGFFPVLGTTFGIMPLYGNDIWLHALTAIVAAYFGFSTQTVDTFGDTTARV